MLRRATSWSNGEDLRPEGFCVVQLLLVVHLLWAAVNTEINVWFP